MNPPTNGSAVALPLVDFARAQPLFRRFFLPAFCLLGGSLWAGTAAAQAPAPLPTAPAAAAPPAAAAGGPVPLDPLLASPTLWQATPEKFPEANGLGFRWVSNAHDALRSTNPKLRLHGLPVVELIARFSPANATIPTGTPGIAPAPATVAATGGKTQLAGLQAFIYNRGDAGDLDARKFDALVEQSKDALNALANVKPVERGVDNSSVAQSRGLIWVTPTCRYLLEWSSTPENRVQGIPYRAEFVRLKVTPEHDQPKNALEQMRAAASTPTVTNHGTTVHASELPARLVKNPDGSELLPNVPMVNQGEKGYCVNAATERVLRYYGADVDQNELAQVANTTASGTTTGDMLAALKKLASRFKVNIITEYSLSYADFIREVDDYNRLALHAPKSSGITPINVRGGTELSLELVYGQMNGELLRDARTKLNPAYMTRFEHDIQAHITRGIPLLWSVYLGLLPEEHLSPSDRGGHMRLIIGYNAKTKEVLYTDTWGRGHELKKMPLANAWTITDGLYTLEPS